MTPDTAAAHAFEVTWPAAEYRDSGAFRTGRGLGAGGRVSSTIALRPDWNPDDLDAAEAVHHDWDQRPMFRMPDSDVTLREALLARGYRQETPTAVMAIDCAALTHELPPMTAFAIWPPIAMQRDLWAAGNISAERQAVMERVNGPHTSILGRIDDRAAGAGFVAIAGNVAMVHAVEVAPQFRRRGLASHLIRAAADWASANGAARMGLAVSRGNTGARTLYDRLGFVEIGAYSYWARP
ncbi:GNAT family N-acetyltransferase [Paracoccus litorisediminis]|uniref:GNAT family N-acetyltransferase n=1 Tax=Paracoccus litorisediminis TaxID=2006130 RepID=A0A844HPP4_9RHOB|nr:GNAT family N-acetyltransferase [Paracoccus litorisediminis]